MYVEESVKAFDCSNTQKYFAIYMFPVAILTPVLELLCAHAGKASFLHAWRLNVNVYSVNGHALIEANQNSFF